MQEISNHLKSKLEEMLSQKLLEIREWVRGMSLFGGMMKTADLNEALFPQWDSYLTSLGCVEDTQEPFFLLHNPGPGGSYLRMPVNIAEKALVLGYLP